MRRTKIIATLGPATDDPQVLAALFTAGTDGFRLNFSHGSIQDHAKRVTQIRHLASEHKRSIAIIADLQGPKIRIARFEKGSVILKENELFTFDADLADDAGNELSVGIDYKHLPQDVAAGDTLLVDDGRLSFIVQSVEKNKIHCQIMSGGTISNNKGINRLGGGLSAEALTEKDREDLKFAIGLEVDYIAISFPRNAEDILEARALIKALQGHASIIAKIERAEAVDNIDEIIEASDVIMVARGDLGVEMGDAELPSLQKRLISRTREKNKVSITATQMMESMIHNSIPTRAEVMDVANAVLDGTDAVMLSAETASGDHPAQVVAAMSRICIGAEKHPRSFISHHRIDKTFHHIDESIAMAAMYTANHFPIKAIICLTETGTTPLWMSRIRSGIPIFALSRRSLSLHKMSLYRGVYPLYFDMTHMDEDRIEHNAIHRLTQLGFLEQNDIVILTKGTHIGVLGGTNALKILCVEEKN